MLYPRIHETLSALRNGGTRLFVASSKPHFYVRKILEHFELIDYFNAVFGSEMDGTRSNKTDLLRFALEETRVKATEAIMVGDRKHDIIGALANRLSPVGVLYGYGSSTELRDAGATRLVHSPDDLLRELA
jgi:phosphoglycolate phosphatase